MSSAEAPVKVGDVVAGKYRVEKVLGVGAMGVVVAARHVELEEMRAIKFMLPAMLEDADRVERFLREARAAVRLKNEHVTKIYDVGRLDTGAPYIVMEHLAGSDLKHVLEQRGPLPVAEVARYVIQACEGLAEAHALGIVHRDLKPANLFLTIGAGGVPCVKILDFGIAKVVAGQDGAMDMTRTSELLGTPLYMSPEQMRSTRSVDARSDIWALGVVLYRMLTARTPFTGSTVTEICAAVIADEPDPPTMLRGDLPPALEAVILRCLEKSPAKRFATVTDLAAALAPFLDARAAAPPPPRPALSLKTIAMDASAPVGLSGPQAPPSPARAVLAMTAPLESSAPFATGPQWAANAGFVAATSSAALPAIVPPAAAQSTAQASTWTSVDAPPPAVRGSRALLAVIGMATLLLVGGGTFLWLRSSPAVPTPPLAGAADRTPAAPSASASVASAPTITPEAPSASATAPPSASSAAPHAPTVPRPVGKAPGKKKDAFGSDRK